MNKNTKLGIAFSTILFLITNGFLFTYADSLTRQLGLGMSGSDVGILQTFLAKDSNLYPEGKITNYFGQLTKAAVAKFQTANGLPSVGRVGPQTLSLINVMLGRATSSAPTGLKPIFNVLVTNNNNGTVNLSWNTNAMTRGTVYYSTNLIETYENENSVTMSGLTASSNIFNTSHSVLLPNIITGTTYYYSVYTTDQNGNVNVTWPGTFVVNSNTGSTTIPTIILPNNPATTTATTTTSTSTNSTTTLPTSSTTAATSSTSTSTGM